MAKAKGVFLEKPLIFSKAFNDLAGTASKVLIWFYYRRKMVNQGTPKREDWDVANNGEIVFPYADAKKRFGLTAPRFQRALEDLVAKGFIDINHHGGGMVGDTSTYWISDRWKLYGKEGFVHKTIPKDTRGLGFTPENWPDRTGKNRRPKTKTGNENVTRTSNKIVTHSPKTKGNRSNKSVTGEKGVILLFAKGQESFGYYSRCQ
ncbi:hypothetical protein NITGR_280105 [Nitrospina gracilis 3/211]|uniref:Uncharacterized protein n=1 Tax=Nitrospina gracilis (strain 3/211) TaxID=1266370 RepID=M1YXH0_NITG3|nr:MULTISPECIES: hypothetical protein [Nitrospina]MCF8723338.1 hypothetical protein [Nitrospina sp. Nb-3]CCQ90389.1 hypothetical protein NITGR_280105 [Nitrospina gracilis 3/211]